MPAGRFILDSALLAPDITLTLPEDIARQARDVLRLSPGKRLRLLDGAGGEYDADILAVSRREVTVRLGQREEGQAPSRVRVTLCLGLLRSAHFEWALQKATELGVATIQPLVTERSVAAAEEFGAAKRHRYERIIAEATEQCGGSWLPTLAAPRALPDALNSMPYDALALIPWEEETAAALSETLGKAARGKYDAASNDSCDVWIFIGPAGGFSVAEVALARERGALPVTLGPRILRAETAAIVAITLALDMLGALHAGEPR